MPHPEGDTRPPDQWDKDKNLTEETAREVVPWTTMDKSKAPKNFRPVPIPSDDPAEVPVEPAPKDSPALESVTSSQESDSISSDSPTPETPMESLSQETPAPRPVIKASGQSKASETSSPSSSKDQNPG